MSSASVNRPVPPRRIGRSVLALLAGAVVNVILSIATDLALHAIGIIPPLGEPAGDGALLLATFYRTVYGVISSYVVARLAPNRPMQHALLGGAIGLVLSTVGAAVTWNSGLGPHWYPVALILLAMPPAWLGGKLRLRQLQTQAG
jgi:hypothetical protein